MIASVDSEEHVFTLKFHLWWGLELSRDPWERFRFTWRHKPQEIYQVVIEYKAFIVPARGLKGITWSKQVTLVRNNNKYIICRLNRKIADVFFFMYISASPTGDLSTWLKVEKNNRSFQVFFLPSNVPQRHLEANTCRSTFILTSFFLLFFPKYINNSDW